MHPELFTIPFTTLTVKSYGLMMVIGFIVAIHLITRLSKKITPDPQMITNAALYSLIAGVLGARIFYVIHYFDKFKDDLLSIFAIWQGGLELLGGVILAITVILFYLKYNKLPVRKYLDILAIALFIALSFGRIGCFLNGCCFGKPTNLPWAVTFPYGSYSYRSQITANPQRDRPLPYIQLPDDFFGYYKEDGSYISDLKPYEYLTETQKRQVTTGPYKPLPVHPTELYSSLAAALLCLLLYLFWKKTQKVNQYILKPGSTFALLFIVYGIFRFFIEFLRDDNPYGFDKLTISQNISIAMVVLGIVLMIIFANLKTKIEPR